jgi:hypothetical protein
MNVPYINFEEKRGAMGWTVQGSDPGGAKYISLLQKFQAGFRAHPASKSVGTGALSLGL